MKLIITLLTIFVTQQVHAFSDHEFCTELVTQNNKKVDKISLRNISTIMFKPKSIVEPEQIYDVENVTEEKQNTNKIVYIQLPEVIYDKNLLKKIQKSERRIIRLKLYKKLKKSTDVRNCLIEIEQNKESFTLIKNHLNLAIKLEVEIKKRKDFFGIKELKAKLKGFSRNGWNIVFSKNIVEFLKDVGEKKPKEILFIAHSDENGKLYDAEKNIFPKNTFHHLTQYVDHFILYSCNVEIVVKQHELKSIFAKKTLTYPLVQEDFKKIFDQKTPLISIRSMLNLSYFKKDQTNQQELCKIKINSGNKEKNLIISLNDYVIGAIHDESAKTFEVECQIVQGKNIVKIFQPTSAEKLKPHINNISITKNSLESQLSIREFLSPINQSHILTIGTNGGIP